jgi:hypothetical protein
MHICCGSVCRYKIFVYWSQEKEQRYKIETVQKEERKVITGLVSVKAAAQ